MIKELLAYAMLIGIFPFAMAVFQRLPAVQAASIVLICGSILLPEGTAIDFPIVPPIEKEYATYLAMLLAMTRYRSSLLRSARLGTGLEWLVVPIFLCAVGTALMNPDPLLDEGKLEPGLGVYWLLATTCDDVLTLGLPFFLGRALIRRPEDLRTLLGILAISGGIYTLPIIVETVMSLPFHVWHLSQVIYGVVVPPQWRWGFLQPAVFMENPLSLASYMAGCVAAAAALLKSRRRVLGYPAALLLGAAAFGLLLTLNVAGNVYGITLALSLLLLRPRAAGTMALSIAALAIGYPSMRMAGVFPREAIVSVATDFDAERARSLNGRFLEEDHVLEHIGDRLLLGWGGIARTPGAETYGDGEQGLDGWWNIQLGARGVSGVLLSYAFLGIPVLLAWRWMIRRTSYQEQVMVAALMGIVAVRTTDLLINGWWNNLPVFLAGALYGLSVAKPATPSSLSSRVRTAKSRRVLAPTRMTEGGTVTIGTASQAPHSAP